MSATSDVIALYTKYLNRTPDATDAGVVFWANQISSGSMTLSQVEISVKASDEYKLIQIYQKYLHRPPEQVGVDYWLAQLPPNGTSSWAGLETAIANSDEAYVVSSYNKILSRDPTADEKASWLAKFAAGTPKTQLGSELAGTDSALASQIKQVYQTLLERDPEDTGLSYWLGRISTGSATIADLTTAIKTSQEYRDKVTKGTTPTIKVDPNNLKISLQSAYKQLFGVNLIDSDLTFKLIAKTSSSTYSYTAAIMADDTGVVFDIGLAPDQTKTTGGTAIDIQMANGGTAYKYTNKISHSSSWAMFQVYNGTGSDLTPHLSVASITANVSDSQVFKQYVDGSWVDMSNNDVYLPANGGGIAYVAVNISGAWTLKGVQYWIQQFNSGAATPDNIQSLWMATPEYKIVETYQALLGRYPDEAGFAYWTAGLTSANLSDRLASLTAAIEGSTEYQDQVSTVSKVTEVTVDSSSTQTIELETIETRAYVFTYVSALSEESAPSDPIVVDLYPGTQTATVTMEAPPTGNFNLQYRRVYRTAVGSAGTNYYFVAELPVGQQVFEDTVAGTDLGEPLPSLNWSEPPSDLNGLIAMPNGFLAGFTGRDVYFSEAYHLHAWPIDYMQSVDYPVVALGQFGQSLVVLTTGSPYLMTGTDPSAITVEKLDFDQSCVSAKSVSRLGGGVAYASPDGLAYIGPDGMQVLTENFFTRKEWQSLKPSTITGKQHDNRYYAFFDDGVNKGGFILDPKSNGSPFVFTDQFYDGLHNDLRNDALYGVRQGTISKLEGGTSLLGYTWRSKQFLLPKPLNFKCSQVVAADYNDISVKYIVDGVEVCTIVPVSQAPFQLPAGYKGRVLEVELSGTSTVIAVHVAESMEELRNV